MGENWQPVFSKTINRTPVSDNRGELSVVSTELYETPENACVAGWNDIKAEAFRGLISSAVPVYDDGVCHLFVQNEVKASLPVINESNRTYGSSPYVTDHVVTVSRSNGDQYLFHYKNGQWISMNGVSARLQQTPEGYIFFKISGGYEVYNTQGLIVESWDSTGHKTSYTYDELGRLASVIGPKGDELGFSYNMDSQIKTVSRNSESVSYQYENGHIKTVTYPDSTTKEYLYEDPLKPHHMTGYINENNILFATWSYDDKGRVVMNEQAGGVNHYDFTYNADGSTTVSNSNNASRTYQFEVVNGAIKIDQITGDRCDTCPNGGIKSYLYNADGYAISKTDWNGNTTTYTRDTQGRELSRTEAAGTPEERTVTTTWDTNLNKPLIVTEPERIIEYRYSPEGRLLSREERPRS
jgi:YD repeat-containing protein